MGKYSATEKFADAARELQSSTEVSQKISDFPATQIDDLRRGVAVETDVSYKKYSAADGCENRPAFNCDLTPAQFDNLSHEAKLYLIAQIRWGYQSSTVRSDLDSAFDKYMAIIPAGDHAIWFAENLLTVSAMSHPENWKDGELAEMKNQIRLQIQLKCLLDGIPVSESFGVHERRRGFDLDELSPLLDLHRAAESDLPDWRKKLQERIDMAEQKRVEDFFLDEEEHRIECELLAIAAKVAHDGPSGGSEHHPAGSIDIILSQLLMRFGQARIHKERL